MNIPAAQCSECHALLAHHEDERCPECASAYDDRQWLATRVVSADANGVGRVFWRGDDE